VNNRISFDLDVDELKALATWHVERHSRRQLAVAAADLRRAADLLDAADDICDGGVGEAP
jgi:hypothetical protein